MAPQRRRSRSITRKKNRSFRPRLRPRRFLWGDGAKGVSLWRIDVSFGAGRRRFTPPPRAAPAHRQDRSGLRSRHQRTAQGSLPRWRRRIPGRPTSATWQAIKRHSVASAATVSITGFRGGTPDHAHLPWKGHHSHFKDPVGAPIFYRDVPLMPSELEKGVIKPLAAEAVPLVAWRLRNVGEARSRVVMENLPVCANCHSFSADGKTMGMDLDGLQGNRGMYILAPVAPEMAVRKQDVIQWSSPAGKLKGNVRIGFMSQVSPDGQYVVTTVNPASMAAARRRASQQLLRGQFQGLPVPPGVLSNARNPELVQPRGRACCSPCPAPTTRALCRWAPSGVPTASPGIRPRPSHGPQSAGCAAREIRRRPERVATPV
jgi:hypothetical protein